MEGEEGGISRDEQIIFFLSEIGFIGFSSIKILPMKIRLFPTVPRIPKKWEEKEVRKRRRA